MTAVGRIQSQQGRIVLVVAICLMIGWALALVSSSRCAPFGGQPPLPQVVPPGVPRGAGVEL